MAMFRDQKGRYNPGIFRGPWRGMAPDQKPQRLSPDRLLYGINHRLEGGVWMRRGGQRLLATVGGPVTGIHDHQIGAARSLVLVQSYYNEAPPTPLGVTLGEYDQELETGYRSIYSADYPVPRDSQPSLVACRFGTEIVFNNFTDANTNKLMRVKTSDATIHETVFELPGGFVGISALIEHEGVLLVAAYKAISDALPNSAIFTWDGLTLTLDLDEIFIVRGFGILRDSCAAVFSGNTGPNSVRVRTSAGVWGAPIAPSGGTVGTINNDVGRSFRDNLYIAPGELPGLNEDGLFRLSPAGVLTRLGPGITGVDPNSSILSVDVFDKKLWYLWTDNVTTTYLGNFDGTTWNAFAKNMTADGMGDAVTLRQYRGSLIVAGATIVGISARTDIQGGPNWKKLDMTTADATARPIIAVVVY